MTAIVFIAGEMKVQIKSREISLTKTELKMLTFFLQNPKQILSKTQILENVFDLEEKKSAFSTPFLSD